VTPRCAGCARTGDSSGPGLGRGWFRGPKLAEVVGLLKRVSYRVTLEPVEALA